MKNTTYLLFTLLSLFSSLGLRAQEFFFSSEQPGSCAATDGIVTIVPTRGVPPFTYQWSTGATEVSIKNVPKGVYSATITDAAGASVTHSHILNSKELDLYLSDAKPSTFCNPNSGALTVDPVGGLPPYAYLWSTGQTSATAQGLPVGLYAVTVQDANGCVALGEYEVKLNPNYYPYAVIQTVQEPDCININDGELKAQMAGSSYYGPHSYAWSNGAASETISNLAAGNYTVTITDALGCVVSTVVALQKALTMTGSVVCTGSTAGTAGAVLVNASAPVSYVWSNGQTGANLANLTGGAYSVTASDANGCSATNSVNVSIPYLTLYDYSQKCYAGNNGTGTCWVNNDQATSYLWDNGATDSWNNTLSPGMHNVTVTTALGCTLVGGLNIAAPVAPPIAIDVVASPADCANGAGGALNIALSGGIPPYNFYAYGPGGFSANNTAALQNLADGSYYLSVSNPFPYNCYTSVDVILPDAGGFNPELIVQDIDCATGYGAAAVGGVTMPGTQYEWSVGAATPDVYNLTPGTYSVTVTGTGSCVEYFSFDLFNDDSLQTNNCFGLATGALLNDLGAAGCNGTAGIPFQLIRTLPSGALNFTDENGVFQVNLPNGAFDIEPANYDPADIACPPGGFFTVNSAVGGTVGSLDFHFFNANPTDHRVRHRALRTAQPGYPYSMRFEVCNDGNTANNGSVSVEYGNFFGSVASAAFVQHTGAFAFSAETAGVPNNEATFNFPAVAPGGCELLQVDFLTPTTTPANTEFITRATVTPSSGDPTPDNNVSTLYNTVVGSFDPNSVYAYPARNGNPRDGGDILRNVDRTVTYQIFFQNTGTAPADLVIVRDTLDAQLDLASIRNITASHDVNVAVEGDNDVLVFKFPNISLPDSTHDYANSIGSVQYEIDLQPGLPLGAEVSKRAAIYFDFNSPVITNNNVLTVVESTRSNSPGKAERALAIFPNPADRYFGFYSEKGGTVSIFDAWGALVATQNVTSGLQQIATADLPNGIYFVRLDVNGSARYGKTVVSH